MLNVQFCTKELDPFQSRQTWDNFWRCCFWGGRIRPRNDGVDEDKDGVGVLTTMPRSESIYHMHCFPDSTKGSGWPTHQQL